MWNSVEMAAGLTFEEALSKSRHDLDGVFTYLLATRDGIGMAKDRWAIKPLACIEGQPDGMGIATEEQALRTLYDGDVTAYNYDEPMMVAVWPATSLVSA